MTGIHFDAETAVGMTDKQRGDFVAAGMGIINLVQRATARASELSNDELRRGGRRLEGLSPRFCPAFGDAKAQLGPFPSA